MRTQSLLRVVVLCCAGAVGCSSSSTAPLTDAGSQATIDSAVEASAPVPLEIFSWWVAPGEAEALDTIMSGYKVKFGADVMNSAVAAGGVDTKKLLTERISTGQPPDMFQVTAGGNTLPSYVNFGTPAQNKLQPLDALYDANGLRAVFPAHVLKGVSYQGSIYGVPVNIHRRNVLFYNKRVFQKIGATDPPVRLEDFYDAAEKAKAAGITPLAMSYNASGTHVSYTFLCAQLAAGGPDFRREYYAGNKQGDDPLQLASIAEFAKMLSYTRHDYTITNWADAANELLKDQAAMFFHGDWVKGFLMAQGFTPDVDFGMISCPGADPNSYIYNSDAFTVPAGAPHPMAVENMVKMIASQETQIAFNRFKGSIPARADIDVTKLDPASRKFVADLQAATYVHNDADVPNTFKDPTTAALTIFAKGEMDQAALAAKFRDSYQFIKPAN